MVTIHQILRSHGLEQAKTLVSTAAERRELEIAAAVMADESQNFGICHAGFALTSLPHKDTQELRWRREGHNVTLVVESGYDRHDNAIGLPYGSRARMILIYLQTQAVRTQSREVELGASLKSWMRAMGIDAIGGNTYKGIQEQARRINACRLTFFTDLGGAAIQRDNGGFVDTAIELTGSLNDDSQPMLWQDRVRLNEAFYRSLIEHPVPVSETALREIGNKSMAIDIYVWLAYRLHALTKPTTVSWAALFGQFGAGYTALKHFKPRFVEALGCALAGYPAARVTVDSCDLTLSPSSPPIAKASERLGRI